MTVTLMRRNVSSYSVLSGSFEHFTHTMLHYTNP
uniref:Uncharacterized protein n=1 Tax=Anguilla anguilla TaxID=7936 RepID=A0A0E9Q598_ANGAN